MFGSEQRSGFYVRLVSHEHGARHNFAHVYGFSWDYVRSAVDNGTQCRLVFHNFSDAEHWKTFPLFFSNPLAFSGMISKRVGWVDLKKDNISYLQVFSRRSLFYMQR